MNEMLNRTFDRNITNLESHQLVWLDTNTNRNCEDTAVLSTRLRSIINYTKLFVNHDECLQYIKKTEGTTTFFIGSNIDDRTILSEINDLRNIYAIYLCTSNDRECDKLITKFPKVSLLL